MTEEPASTTRPEPLQSISLLGIRIHRVDMDTTLARIREWVGGDEPHMIVTADASMVVIAQGDEDFRGIVNDADLVTPDGAGILLGSKLLGMPLEHKVSGVEIARHICRMAAEAGFGVFFFGAAPGIAELAAENVAKDCPGLSIAGTRNGFFTGADNGEIVSQIRNSGAKVLLVAMGIPKQEKWIRNHLSELGVSVAIGVGGTFDVFSGKVKRAPEWMQRHGLEWLYRLACNPSKISKVATLPKFMALVLREKLRGS